LKVEVVCSWCNGYMGWKEFEFSARDEIHRPITHGICRECLKKEMAKIKAMPINKNQKTKEYHHDTDSIT